MRTYIERWSIEWKTEKKVCERRGENRESIRFEFKLRWRNLHMWNQFFEYKTAYVFDLVEWWGIINRVCVPVCWEHTISSVCVCVCVFFHMLTDRSENIFTSDLQHSFFFFVSSASFFASATLPFQTTFFPFRGC